MIKNITLEGYFKEHLKNDGFRKSSKHRTWFKKFRNNTFFVLNMEKSRWDNCFYFNVGINFSEIEGRIGWDEEHPDICSCTVSSRAEQFENNRMKLHLRLMASSGVADDSNLELIKNSYNYIIKISQKTSSIQDFINNFNHEDSLLQNYAEWMDSAYV
jgi:hypothetical protein